MAREQAISVEELDSIQRRTNRFQSKNSDLWDLSNADTSEIGSVGKGMGYLQRASDLTTTTSTSTSTSTTTTTTSTSSSTSSSTSTTTS